MQNVKPGVRRILLYVVKGALSALLLYLLLRGGKWERIVALTRASFHVGPFLLGLGAFAMSNILGGLQWRVLLRAQGIRIGLRKAVSLYYVGLFFSNFLPANIGGDVVKIVDVYRSSGRGGGAVAATMVDRAIGLAMLALMACAAAPFALPATGMKPIFLLLPLFFLFFVAGAALVISRRADRLLQRAVETIPSRWVREKGRTVLGAVLEYGGRRRALVTALAIALPVQTLRILVHYFAARSIGIEADARFFFLFIPIVAVFIALPISINGIGVREGFGVLLYGEIGIPPEGAVTISFLAYVIGVLVSLVGGALFIGRSFLGRGENAPTPPLQPDAESR